MMLDDLFFTLVAVGIAGSFIGTLAGGGGLITLPAMMLFGIPIQYGIASNKFATGISALFSVTYLWKHKILQKKSVWIEVCISVVGGMSGAMLTAHMTEKTMNVVVFVLLLFAFIVTLKNKQLLSSTSRNPESHYKYKITCFFIALYDGGFGPGSSTFSILNYLHQSYDYITSVQLARAVVFGSCTGAFFIFYQTGFVDWHYAIAMAVGSTIGSQLGLIALPYVPLKWARTMLITILILLIGQVCLKML